MMQKLKPDKPEKPVLPDAVEEDDFLYYSPENKLIYRKTGTLWPMTAADLRLPWIGKVRPSVMIARKHAVEQMTWAPGEPRLIRHKLVIQGGWIESPNATVYNHYQAPHLTLGDVNAAAPWVDHVHMVYPEEADHIIKWLACRVQHPEIKINHALVLGGAVGIGKDSLLYPAVNAVGHWNVESVSPQQMLGRFNGHLKSVLLLVSEARDLGEINRPQFYEHLKLIIAAPPDVLLIDEKNRQPYYIPNLCGVVITTNHKVGGIFLAPDDRRHFVAWSPLDADGPGPAYFDTLWQFYADGGLGHVAAYLWHAPLGGFDPKAPPPKTQAFHEIVTASQQIEAGELAGVLDNLGHPDVVTILDICCHPLTETEFAVLMRERKNRRQIARWFEEAGYVAVPNPNNKQGLWKLGSKYQAVYGKNSLSLRDLYWIIGKRTQ
jgi:hypothetical protein